jgi:hypothetical protein
MRRAAWWCLSALVAGCTAAPRADVATAVQPSEIATAICLEKRPGDEAACRDFHLPDPTTALAYGVCLQHRQLDPKSCKDLRLAFESELRAYLSRPAPEAPTAMASQPSSTPQRARELRQTAEQLYRATSSDAQTFEAALVIPSVRQKIVAVLRQDMSDEKLRALASQARSEALYWYAYMQGLERSANLR